MRKKKIANLIDKALGARVKQATYSYSDIILYWIYANLCGAERLEDTVFLKAQLEGIPDLAIPSPDRISGIFRSLATPTFSTPTKNGQKHEFSNNMTLNRLMLGIAKKLDVISGDTLDYDNVIIETHKQDSTWTYKKVKGYQPGVGFIGQTPVYIEGRGGNSPAMFRIADSIEKCLRLLKDEKISFKYFRSDSAAYQFDVIKILEEYNKEFFIRADTVRALREEAEKITFWETFTTSEQTFDIGEMDYLPFFGKYSAKEEPKFYRVVVKRVKGEKGNYSYYSIITNNTSMTPGQVLHFYNQRGAMERNFDDLKNNFNWKRIPFSHLNENLVFIIISAIANIIYQYLIKTFSKKLDFVKRNFRLKNFIFHFITVSSQWTKGRLKLFTDKNYRKIFE